MTPIPLQDLARRLSQQESELQALRRELEVRQHQVADLTRRKEGLLTQLQQIDGEIAALVTGSRPAAAGPGSRRPGRPEVAPATNKAPTRVASPQSSAAGEMSLPKLIVEMLRAASGPL